MVKKQPYQAYAAATQTVAKTKQVVLLYDGAIRFLQQAKDAIDARRIEDRYHMLTKASEVIIGLQSCLDFENGGDVAKLLYNFYSSIDLRIFAIHRNGNAATCEEIIAELRAMRDAWQEIDTQASPGSPPSPPSGTPGTDDTNVTFSA